MPASVAVSGTTLWADPACSWVIDSTQVSCGGMLRDRIVWICAASVAAIISASLDMCGAAAWLPRPEILMSKNAAPAMAAPLQMPTLPSGVPGELCMP